MRGGVFVHLLDRLTLACVSSGLGFCVEGSSVRCNATSRQYCNCFVKVGIVEGVWIWCMHRIVTSLVLAKYVGNI